MKILFTPVRFYPYLGGVEYSSYHLAKSLVELGCDVKVICAFEGPGSENETIDGILVNRVRYVGKLANTPITLGLPWTLLHEPFDLVLTYMPTPWSADWSALLAKVRRKRSVIYIKNDLGHTRIFARLITYIYKNTLFRVSLALADKIFVVNQEWETVFRNTRKLIARHSNKVVVIPNGTDTQLFAPQDVRRTKNEILFVSVLSKYHHFKGLADLLSALSIVKDDISDVRLRIVGGGELMSYYQDVVSEMALTEYVTFVGKVDQNRLAEVYSRCSVFALPSTGVEGHANAVIEALACATPVVVTDVIGMAKDIADYNCGCVISPFDPHEMARVISVLLRDDDLRRRMGSNGRKLVCEKYQWGSVAAKVFSECAGLVSGSAV